MKETADNEQWLDQLLEQPPILADSGFAESLVVRIKRKERLRKRVFMAAGSTWLLLLALLFPRQAIISISQGLADAGSRLQVLLRSLMEMDYSVLLTQPGSVTMIIVILFAVYALVSLQIKGQ